MALKSGCLMFSIVSSKLSNLGISKFLITFITIVYTYHKILIIPYKVLSLLVLHYLSVDKKRKEKKVPQQNYPLSLLKL